PFKRSIIEPTRSEIRSAEEVFKIPGISPKKTFQQNYNLIKTQVGELAENLKKSLEKKNFIFPKKELISRLEGVKSRLAENPVLVGDAEKTAGKLISKFRDMVENSPAKGAELLETRKKFDRWVES